jgi:hypothetical protein
MKISTKITDKERHYLQNLLDSKAGEVPNILGKVSAKATHILLKEDGFIVGAKKIIKIDKPTK